jgi:hypothetical protein
MVYPLLEKNNNKRRPRFSLVQNGTHYDVCSTEKKEGKSELRIAPLEQIFSAA